MAQDENGLEPHRRMTHSSPMSDTTPTDVNMERPPTPDDDVLWNRREAEEDLERRPSVTTYPGGMAGAVQSKESLGENQKYGLRITERSQENIFAPFASQLDWEVARWAKIRGPGSNSFTELMAIDGVSRYLVVMMQEVTVLLLTEMKVHKRLGVSFKNSRELNELIDKHLPGRPPFRRKEMLVGDEVCELYFRDIIQCICVLFGDQDFAPYLIMAPERHYTDDDKEERMYHDMHTGGWWWFTQVRRGGNVVG